MVAWAALLGCGGGTPAPPPDLALPSTSGTAFVALHRRAGEVDLSAVPEAVDVQLTDTFDVKVEAWEPKGGAAAWRGDLPFPISEEDARFKPMDMRVRVNGVDLPFSRQPLARANQDTWRLMGGKLVVTHANPPGGVVQVVYPGVRVATQRHDPRAWSGAAWDFAKYDLTVEGVTRQGLLLPSGATASWRLTLPPGARFEAHLALEPTPIPGAQGDGAAAVLDVIVAGARTEVARSQVAKAGPFAPMTADLSAFAGQEVTLILRTEAGETAAWDWLFYGSPSVVGTPASPPRRIVVVALDTTRPDHIGFNGYARGATPEMDRIARQSMAFDAAWSQAPRTRPSFRSSTTGRTPLEAVGAPNTGTVFSSAGWATAGFVANVHLQPRFDFHQGFDVWTYTGEERADVQVDRALAWLQGHADRDTYLFLHIMDPHLPYGPPGELATRFVSDPDPDLGHFERGDVLGWMRDGTLDDRRKKHIEALHDGEMTYTSQQLGRLFDGLDTLNGPVSAAVYSDHGEEFWEHGGFEHNHALFDETVRAVLWFRPKGGFPEGKRLTTPVSLIDLPPTLYAMAGVTPPDILDGRSLTSLFTGPAGPEWRRPLGLGHLQYGAQRWGVIVDNKKYVLMTASGKEEVYDLATDPQERTNLIDSTDTGPLLAALRGVHAGLDVGPGWRVRVNVQPCGAPLTLTLPQPARSAGVLDPEAARDNPANQEWGEAPEVLPEDVGSAVLSKDGMQLSIQPGTVANGIVWVRFDVPAAGAPQIVRGDETLTVSTGKKSNHRWETGTESVVVEPGTVVVPPIGEWTRMMALRGNQSVSQGDREELIRLGYLSPDAEDHLPTRPGCHARP